MANAIKINNEHSKWHPDTKNITDNIDTYSLTEIPREDSEWVQEAREGILFHIDLEDLVNDLSHATDLIYLATNASKRGEMTIDLDELQGDVIKLYGKCWTTMAAFAKTSNQASIILTRAFKNLFEGKEDSAISALKDLALKAREMNKKATTIAEEFNTFKEVVKGQSRTLQLKVITSYDELDELISSAATLQTNANVQRSLEKELKINIEQLSEELAEAKATAKDEATKAFVLQILGGLFSAVGAGLGAYAMSQNPVGMITKVAGDTVTSIADAKDDVNDAKKDLTPEKKEELEQKIKEQETATKEKDEAEAKVKDLKNIVEKFDDEIKKATEEKTTAENDIAIAEKQIEEVTASDDDDKDEKIEIAEESIESAEETIGQKDLLIKSKNKRKGKKEKELVTSEEKLTAAKAKWEETKAAVDAIAAGLNKLSEKVDQMSDKAEKRAESARESMTKILSLKQQVQKERREATAKIIELVGEIKANDDDQDRKKDQIHCLEISVWALSNLFVTFERASFFWSNIAEAADKLSDPKIQNIILETIANVDELNERIKIYESEDFVRMSIPSVIGWKALNSICVEYVAKTDKAVKLSENNKANYLGPEKARKKLDVMKSTLMNTLSSFNGKAIITEKELQVQIDELKAADFTKV